MSAPDLDMGEKLLDAYTKALEHQFKARLHPGMIRMSEAAVAADMAEDDLRGWIKRNAATARRVAEMEGEIDALKHDIERLMAATNAELARATAAEAQVKEMRSERDLNFDTLTAVVLAISNNNIAGYVSPELMLEGLSWITDARTPGARHCGDCTKQPCTCVICYYEDYRSEATKLVEIARATLAATKEVA